ncbi:MAG: hypothetical protein WCH75_03840, partial [Candidatus Binatia bacterium]
MRSSRAAFCLPTRRLPRTGILFLFLLPTSWTGKEFSEDLQRKPVLDDQLFQISKSPDVRKMPSAKET